MTITKEHLGPWDGNYMSRMAEWHDPTPLNHETIPKLSTWTFMWERNKIWCEHHCIFPFLCDSSLTCILTNIPLLLAYWYDFWLKKILFQEQKMGSFWHFPCEIYLEYSSISKFVFVSIIIAKCLIMRIKPIRFPLHSVQKQTKLSIVLEGIIRKVNHSKMVES